MDVGRIQEEANEWTPCRLRPGSASPGLPCPVGSCGSCCKQGPLPWGHQRQHCHHRQIDQSGARDARSPHRATQRSELEQTDASSLFRPCHGSQASLLRGPLSLRSRCALVSKDDFDSKHRVLLLPFMAPTSVSFLTLVLIFHLSLQVTWLPRSPRTQNTRSPAWENP